MYISKMPRWGYLFKKISPSGRGGRACTSGCPSPSCLGGTVTEQQKNQMNPKVKSREITYMSGEILQWKP